MSHDINQDPHGFHEGEDHGHVILDQKILLGVLFILVFFTLLTVFISQFEGWVGHVLDLDIPHWFNVVVAMSIAVVKSVFVCAYFMQLKYDNKLNLIIFLTCIGVLGLFLGFTMLDLGARGEVYRWKDTEAAVGGSGVTAARVNAEGQLESLGMPLRDWVQQNTVQIYLDEHPGDPVAGFHAFEAHVHEHDAHSAHPFELPQWYFDMKRAAYVEQYGPAEGNRRFEAEMPSSHDLSDADRSRLRHGRTPGLFDEHVADDHGHGEHGHDDHGHGSDHDDHGEDHGDH